MASIEEIVAKLREREMRLAEQPADAEQSPTTGAEKAFGERTIEEAETLAVLARGLEGLGLGKVTMEQLAALHARKPRWQVGMGGSIYQATSEFSTVAEMEPGLYDIGVSQGGLFFKRVPIRTDELIRFPGTDQDRILSDITKFWEQGAAFRGHDLPYKRGILLYGPPGSGKSCTLQLVGRDVVERGGVILQFSDPDLFVAGYREFRMVQPGTPLVVVMEDLDTIMERKNDSKVLNLLDGAEVADNVVFLATTNYPEKLGPRIMNRPSRFDRVYKVPHPGEASRMLYLERLTLENDIEPAGPVNLARWAADTNGLSLAHLKELFVAVTLLGAEYDDTLAVLRDMKRRRVSAEDEEEFEPLAVGRYA